MTELPCDYQGILANGHFEVYILVTVSVPIQKGTCIRAIVKVLVPWEKKLRSYYQFIYRQKIFKKDLITTCICKRTLIVTEGLF